MWQCVQTAGTPWVVQKILFSHFPFQKIPKKSMRFATCKWQRGRWRWWYEGEKKKIEISKVVGGQCNIYTMVKEQCDCLNVCVYYSTSMTTIIFRGTPHLIYLGPIHSCIACNITLDLPLYSFYM